MTPSEMVQRLRVIQKFVANIPNAPWQCEDTIDEQITDACGQLENLIEAAATEWWAKETA